VNFKQLKGRMKLIKSGRIENSRRVLKEGGNFRSEKDSF
jgi:hypothetical protein